MKVEDASNEAKLLWRLYQEELLPEASPDWKDALANPKAKYNVKDIIRENEEAFVIMILEYRVPGWKKKKLQAAGMADTTSDNTDNKTNNTDNTADKTNNTEETKEDKSGGGNNKRKKGMDPGDTKLSALVGEYNTMYEEIEKYRNLPCAQEWLELGLVNARAQEGNPNKPQKKGSRKKRVKVTAKSDL